MRVSRKPTLTPSKITTYLACPTKYFWTFVDDRGHWYRRERSTYSFGTSLHAALETFHADENRGLPTVDQAIAVLEENWVSAGYSSQEEMMEAFGQGEDIIERYLEEVKALPMTGRTLFVEKTLHHDFKNWRLTGRVDRLSENEDGSLEIIDYKTGRDQVEADDVRFDIAMACYDLLVRRAYPNRVVRTSLWALRSGVKATYEYTPSEIEGFEVAIERLGDEILSRRFDQPPVAKTLCARCDFLKLCSRQDGYAASNEVP